MGSNVPQQDTGVRMRRAAASDRQTLAKLMVRAYADVRARQTGEVLARTWADWEANHVQTIDLDRVVLAEAAGKTVGFASYDLDRGTRIGLVSDNAVLPDFRGRGVGGELLARVLAIMREAGMEFAQVFTGPEEPYAPARRMYERHGFRPFNRSVLYARQLAQSVSLAAAAGVHVRRAAESDRETLQELSVRAFADVTVLRWREESFGVIGGRPWQAWEADLMRTMGMDRVFVAEFSGNAVGFATYELDDGTRIGTVGDNAVLPAYRGRGIGGQLLSRMLELMVETGMEFARVETGLAETYAFARRMYERQGFVPIHHSIHYMMNLAQRVV